MPARSRRLEHVPLLVQHRIARGHGPLAAPVRDVAVDVRCRELRQREILAEDAQAGEAARLNVPVKLKRDGVHHRGLMLAQ